MSDKIKTYIQTLRSAWRDYLRSKRIIREVIITIVALVSVLVIYTRFLGFIETREGIVLNDYLLSLFKPINLTWLIFAALYSACLIGIAELAMQPRRLVIGIQAYIVLVLLRMTAMYLVPLNPPADIIKLIDPFVELFGTGATLTKDLFFSGHTATAFILYLLVEKGWVNKYLLLSSICIGICVLLQHVHYTIDVVFAPIFTYLAYTVIAYKKNRV